MWPTPYMWPAAQPACCHCPPLPAGCLFRDAFSAWDELDGNLTAGASSFGTAAVDTSAPTPPSQPFLITYAVADAAGNQAAVKQRRVAVVCPPGEAICNSSSILAGALSRGRAYCSSHGMCLGPPPSSGGSSSSSSANGAGSSSSAAQLPQLTLTGPAVVFVGVGAQYAACPASPPADLLCDRWVGLLGRHCTPNFRADEPLLRC